VVESNPAALSTRQPDFHSSPQRKCTQEVCTNPFLDPAKRNRMERTAMKSNDVIQRRAPETCNPDSAPALILQKASGWNHHSSFPTQVLAIRNSKPLPASAGRISPPLKTRQSNEKHIELFASPSVPSSPGCRIGRANFSEEKACRKPAWYLVCTANSKIFRGTLNGVRLVKSIAVRMSSNPPHAPRVYISDVSACNGQLRPRFPQKPAVKTHSISTVAQQHHSTSRTRRFIRAILNIAPVDTCLCRHSATPSHF
jgi:hypothetical protein